jgi:eukaryotic-like serine/threonine-protein kinase
MKKIASLISCLLMLIQLTTSQEIKKIIDNDFRVAPQLKWKFKANAPLFSSPIINENIVYFGSLDSSMYAVSIETGQMKWKVKTQGQIRSTVYINNKDLYFTGCDGIFYCLNKYSGDIIWTFKTNGEKVYELYGYADYFTSSPVYYDSKIFFGSGDGNIYSLNAENGSLIWKYKTDDVVHTNPIVYDNTLYIGSFDGNFYALDIVSGNLKWKFKSVGQRFFPKGEFQGTPVAGNGLIFVGSRDYNLYAIDANKGYCHWNKQFPLGWALALSYKDTVLYSGTSDDDVMIAFDALSGKELWRTNVNFNIFGACSSSGTMIYFGTINGKLFGLDSKSGAVIWTFKTDGFILNNKKYFKSEDSIVKNDFYTIVKNPEGYIKALYDLGGIFTTPAMTNDLIIFTSLDGTAYCLSK